MVSMLCPKLCRLYSQYDRAGVRQRVMCACVMQLARIWFQFFSLWTNFAPVTSGLLLNCDILDSLPEL